MKSTPYRSIELFLLFVGIPISFVLEFPIWIKLILGVLGFGYVVFVLLRIEKNQFKISNNLNWKQFWKQNFGNKRF